MSHTPEHTEEEAAESNFSAVVNAAAGGFERPNEAPPEPEDPKEETLRVQRARGEQSQEVTPVVGLPGGAGDAPKGRGKAPARIVGEIPLGVPQSRLQQREDIRQKEIEATKAQSFIILQEGRALAQTKADAQYIFEQDYDQMRELNDTSLARWQRESKELRDDIDAARALKVNPHNFMQSIGRSGRVSSVLSVAVSQMAAGAGSPNAAWARLQAAVTQDISVQKANIALRFSGITAAKDLQKHEADMLTTFYDFEDRARAVGMASLAAQAGVIKQHAANEQEYVAWQMIEDRADAASTDAFAISASKKATALIDMPIRNRADALRHRDLQNMLVENFAEQAGLGGEAREVDPTISLSTGETFGEPVQGAPAQAGTPTAPPVSAPPAGRVATDRRQRPVEGGGTLGAPPLAGTPLDDLTVGVSLPSGQTGQLAVAGTETPEAVEPGPEPTPGIDIDGDGQPEAGLTREAYDRATARMPRATRDKGGFAFTPWARQRRPIPAEANTFQNAVKILYDPLETRIDVFPSYQDAIAGRVLDPRKNSARKRYEQAHPDLYRQLLPILHEGTATNPRWIEQNFLDTAHGRIPLKYTSTLIDDEKARAEVTERFNGDYNRVLDMYSSTKSLMQTGSATFFGFLNFSSKTGFEITPFNAAESAEVGKQRSLDMQLAIKAMKLLDESGRLTDQDIKVGRQVMNALSASPSIIIADALESAWRFFGDGEYDQNEARQGVQRFMIALANKMQEQLAVRQYGDIVLTYDQFTAFDKQRQAVSAWLGQDTEKKEEPLDPEPMPIKTGDSIGGSKFKAGVSRAK